MIRKRTITRLTLTMSLAGILFVCNNLPSLGQNASDMPALPFNAVVIKHMVADYSRWRPIFDADSTFRNSAGMHPVGVARGIENENEVEVPFMIDDVQKAKAFTADPKLKDAMQKGGVSSEPNIKFVKVLRMTDALKEPGDFVEVSHKVKDFDAWLKVFDGEGAETRAKDGLYDGLLARGIDDPNLVYLVFKITDLSKAKAALDKPERQKTMKDAGVIGKPEIYFGRDQQ